jgi:hypothetical protein
VPTGPPFPSADGPEPDPTHRSPYSRHGTPAPLAVAAGLTLIEGLLTFVYGLGQVLNIDSDQMVIGVSTSIFFLAYGAGLLACSWGLNAVRPWARGPVLLAQLIWLGLAWSFRDGATLLVALFLAVFAVVALAGLLHPRSIEALERASERD